MYISVESDQQIIVVTVLAAVNVLFCPVCMLSSVGSSPLLIHSCAAIVGSHSLGAGAHLTL